MKPEVAFYYPGQYWYDADWIKNLILFFDGIAMLIPEYMETIEHSMTILLYLLLRTTGCSM